MKQIYKLFSLILTLLSVSLSEGCASITKHPMAASSSPVETAPFSVTFLDVGQADASVIQCDGHYMMIDGGNKDDSSLIYQYLKANDISHFDLVIGTHADEDHIGGLAGAFHFADADMTLCSTDTYDSDAFKDFKSYAMLRGGGIKIPSIGDVYSVGDASVEILSVNNRTESNDSSIVTKVTYGDTSFLFTGDAEMETEQFLLNSESDLRADVLKVSHHGSSDSTSAEFLKRVNPKYAVVSVGKDNTYGHPSDGVLERLKLMGTAIFRTDYHGDIRITSDGSTIQYHLEHSDSKLITDNHIENSTKETYENETTYILNTRSKKFHKLSCDSIEAMSEKNKLEYQGSKDQLLNLNYEPCGGCKP